MSSADRGFTWSDEETSALLNLWGDFDPHNNSTGNKRNFVIYESISQQMKALGYNRSCSQCREKIKRMKREYTLTKQFNGSTSGPKKLMRFFEEFDKIFTEKQLRNQRNTTLKVNAILDTAVTQTSHEKVQHKESLNNKIIESFLPDNLKQTDETPWAPDVVLIEEEPTPCFQLQNDPSHSNTSNEPSRKKRKKIASKMLMFKDMMDSVTERFHEYQQSFDNKFLAKMEALEQERRKTDENIQKLWLEFEEKERKLQQEHELNMFSTFKDILEKLVKHKTSEAT